MDDTLKQIAQQIPSLAALIWLMAMVFKYISARDKFIQELHREHEEARKASREVIEANTKIVGESIEVMRSVSQAIQSCRYQQNRPESP